MTARRVLKLTLMAIICAPLLTASSLSAAPFVLADLVKEYEVRGLPLPPKAARLVRYYEITGTQTEMNGLQVMKKPLYTARLAIEAALDPDLEAPEFRGPFPAAEDMAPLPVAADGVMLTNDEALVLAIRCQMLGWKELAQTLLNRSYGRSYFPPGKQLVQIAYRYWDMQLTYPMSDRVMAAKQLAMLLNENPFLDTYGNRQVLADLNAALVPSKAPPASIEAMIDSFVDYSDIIDVAQSHRNYAGRMATASGMRSPVALVGFEAVPALIAHLDDQRLTRAIEIGGYAGYRHVQVGDIARDLLKYLAGRDQYAPYSDGEIAMWWASVQPMGEEAYLQNLITPMGSDLWRMNRASEYLLDLIVMKYPGILPVLYRRVLDEKPQFSSQMIVGALLRSKLPLKEQLDLFVYGAKHPNTLHKLFALRALQVADPLQCNGLLIAAIDSLPVDVVGLYAGSPEVAIVELANGTDDPLVWKAAIQAAKRSVVGLRMEMLDQFASLAKDGQRMNRLQLLNAFLDDSTLRNMRFSRKYDGSAGSRFMMLEVGNFAAMHIAAMLGIPVTVTPMSPEADFVALRTQAIKTVQMELAPPK